MEDALGQSARLPMVDRANYEQRPVDSVSAALESHWERDLVPVEQENGLLRVLPVYAEVDRALEDVGSSAWLNLRAK